MLFYIIFGTNLLTQRPVSISVFSIFCVLKKRNIKRSPNGIKLYDDFSWTRRHPEDLESKPEEPRGGGTGGGGAPALWPPRESPDLPLRPI